MWMSEQGQEMLVGEEGEVLRAYRCPAGMLTIGVGLTATSGVIKPKPGQTITREESRRLLRAALGRNYEPRVAAALGAVRQHVFDGSVSFDFNTGAIHKASWVGKYQAGVMAAAGMAFKQWNKAGGKVQKGLVGRRNREWALIEFGRYPDGAASVSPVRFGLAVLIGRSIRYFGQGYLAVLYGEQAFEIVKQHGAEVGIGLAVLAVVIGASFYWIRKRQR